MRIWMMVPMSPLRRAIRVVHEVAETRVRDGQFLDAAKDYERAAEMCRKAAAEKEAAR